MSDHPFQSPQAGGQPAPNTATPDREKLRRVAKYQRWVLYALLANVITNILMFTSAAQAVPPLLLLAIIAVAVVFMIVAVVLLGMELYHPAIAIVCGILMFAPCISLITLVTINQAATTYLQRAGIKVGFMGANPDSI